MDFLERFSRGLKDIDETSLIVKSIENEEMYV